jgi:glycosyltransferase involved in cell wall biosynthesis
VAPGDVAALAGALGTLVRDGGEAGRLGAAARARVLARFGLEPMAQAYASLYRTLLGRR